METVEETKKEIKETARKVDSDMSILLVCLENDDWEGVDDCIKTAIERLNDLTPD